MYMRTWIGLGNTETDKEEVSRKYSGMISSLQIDSITHGKTSCIEGTPLPLETLDPCAPFLRSLYKRTIYLANCKQ